MGRFIIDGENTGLFVPVILNTLHGVEKSENKNIPK